MLTRTKASRAREAEKEGATNGDALLNCYPLMSINAPPDRFHYCVRCLPGGSLSPLPALLCRENALSSLFEVSENALMGHQDWIAGLAGTTAAADVGGFVLGVPQCDLKRRIAQDDALQISHAGAPAALGDRPSTVVPEIVAIAHLAGDMTRDHFDHAGVFEIVLGCRPAALRVPIETRDQLVELLVEDVVRIQISGIIIDHIKFLEHARNAQLRSIVLNVYLQRSF
jgi:hypothetical protein